MSDKHKWIGSPHLNGDWESEAYEQRLRRERAERDRDDAIDAIRCALKQDLSPVVRSILEGANK